MEVDADAEVDATGPDEVEADVDGTGPDEVEGTGAEDVVDFVRARDEVEDGGVEVGGAGFDGYFTF